MTDVHFENYIKGLIKRSQAPHSGYRVLVHT